MDGLRGRTRDRISDVKTEGEKGTDPKRRETDGREWRSSHDVIPRVRQEGGLANTAETLSPQVQEAE